MTEYLILIYEQESGYAEVGKRHGRRPGRRIPGSRSRSARRAARSSAATRSSRPATATSIRDDVVTDGPFAETKEALGGYYLIEARDLDHALDIAKLCPAPYGGVEVRPIMDVSGSMSHPARGIQASCDWEVRS